MNQPLVDFVRTLFEDGTIARIQTPEELQKVLPEHSAYVQGSNPFFVSACDQLNELSPVEVLAGRRFQAAIDNPLRVVWEGSPGKAGLTPLTAADFAAYSRMLDRTVEERAAKVMHAAKHWGEPF